VIDCDMALPELTGAPSRGEPDVVVRRGPRRRVRASASDHYWRLPDGTRWVSVRNGGREHVLDFQQFAQFRVADCGRSIRWHAPAATRPETVRHLLLDQVLPAVAFEHSLIGLHASAVVVSGEGIAFAGPASRGKSTLAASFAADGHAIVTDDCLMLQWRRADARAVPSYPSLRLWKSTAERLLGPTPVVPVAQYTSKVRVGARVPRLVFRRQPVRVRKIYVLERRAGAARIDALSGREAYIELLKTTFRLNPLDRAAARREIAALSAIVDRVPVARLRVPLRLESLAGVRQAIAADLAGSHQPSL
jgi:hypothetical protein